MKIIQILYAPAFRNGGDVYEDKMRVMVGKEVMYGLGNDGNVYMAVDRGENKINVQWQLLIDKFEVVGQVEPKEKTQDKIKL